MRMVLRWSATVFALVAAAGGLGAAPATPAAAAETARCCYTNHRYAGVCVVEPAEGETCASILAYLNNPQSQGKAYCGNTTIRGSWKQAKCAKGQAAATSRQ
jgi:hypothetical protein